MLYGHGQVVRAQLRRAYAKLSGHSLQVSWHTIRECSCHDNVRPHVRAPANMRLPSHAVRKCYAATAGTPSVRRNIGLRLPSYAVSVGTTNGNK